MQSVRKFSLVSKSWFPRIPCSFSTGGQVTPLEIVFDLDPPDRENFVLAVKAAKLLKQILDDLNLVSFVKTSGNKGLQIYIPIREGSMTYDETVFLPRR